MFEKTASAIRHTTGNRFTPFISLLCSSAAAALLLLLVLPASTNGNLDRFHLINLDTSKLSQQTANLTTALNLSPTADDRPVNLRQLINKRDKNIPASGDSSPIAKGTTYNNATASTNVTTATITVSVPAPTLPSTKIDIDDTLTNVLRSLTSGNSTQLENVLKEFLKNITSGLVVTLNEGHGELGGLFGGLIQNITAKFEHGQWRNRNSSAHALLQDLFQGGITGNLAESKPVNFLVEGALTNFSTGLERSLSKAQGAATTSISAVLGVQQFYSLHLLNICAGTRSGAESENSAKTLACFTYPQATNEFAKLLSNISSAESLLSSNGTVSSMIKAKDISRYIVNLTTILSKTIFAFYLISLLSSGAIIFSSLLGFLFPASTMIMYFNLLFSTISALLSLAASATITAFITTATNIINLFGIAIDVKASIGIDFLILTWTACGCALITSWYVLAIWFFQFRTIEVKVQRRSPQLIIPTSPQRLVGLDNSGDTVPTMNTFNTANTFGSTKTLSTRRHSRKQSTYANF